MWKWRNLVQGLSYILKVGKHHAVDSYHGPVVLFPKRFPTRSGTIGPPFFAGVYMSHAATKLVWNSKIEHRRKFVLVAIADRINEDGIAWPSMADLGRMCDLSERHVQRIVADCAEFLKVEYRPGRSTIYRLNEAAIRTYTPDADVVGTHDAHVTPDVDVTPDAHVVTPTTPTSPTHDAHVVHNRKGTVKEPSIPIRKVKFSDWDMDAATACEQRLLSAGNLTSELSETDREKWADEFRKLRTIDGKSEEQIALVMRWLFDVDDWWIPKGNFCTAMKLRDKKHGQTLFERFEVKALKAAESRSASRNGQSGTRDIAEAVARQMATGS